MKLLDPQAGFLRKSNQIFLLSCFIAVFMDPLFFYILVVDDNKKCLGLHKSLETIVCVLRTLTDICYLLRIIFQFKTGYVAPSRVFGRGELVDYPVAMAKRYSPSCFIIDAFSILPLPQVMILFVIPSLKRPVPLTTKDALQIMVLVQSIPRVVRIFPLFKEVTSTSGILTEAAWAGAAFNLFLYMLASHVIGALWYLLSIERVDKCWRQEFHRQNLSRQYLYCSVNRGKDPVISNLDMVKLLKTACPSVDPDEIKNSTTFSFGIFADALTSGVVQSLDFPFKFFYCFQWGLSNLSSLGQNLKPGTYVWEILFEVFISIFGLVLFSLLIGNMQKYLESISVRFEEMRVKRERRRKYERWMAHRMLPEDLKERIKRYERYIWQETRGIEEEDLIRNLPKDLRRDIMSHLFLDLVRRMPLFEKMDEQLLGDLCGRLKPVLYTEESYIIREGDPVDGMYFVTKGTLVTSTTDGGRTGFFNSEYLKAGDFFCEELMRWVFEPKWGTSLPMSTRTVRALTEVESFAVMPDDLKFVVNQFRRLHGKQVEHIFRFYSKEWRTWAAFYIQGAWRRYCRKKLHKSLHEAEDGGGSSSLGSSSLGTTSRSGIMRRSPQTQRLSSWKPLDPDFAHNS